MHDTHLAENLQALHITHVKDPHLGFEGHGGELRTDGNVGHLNARDLRQLGAHKGAALSLQDV